MPDSDKIVQVQQKTVKYCRVIQVAPSSGPVPAAIYTGKTLCRIFFTPNAAKTNAQFGKRARPDKAGKDAAPKAIAPKAMDPGALELQRATACRGHGHGHGVSLSEKNRAPQRSPVARRVAPDGV